MSSGLFVMGRKSPISTKAFKVNCFIFRSPGKMKQYKLRNSQQTPHFQISHTNIKRNYEGAEAKLFPILICHSQLLQTTELQIYETMLRPIIGYFSLIWDTPAKTHRKQLEFLQNKTARQICNTLWFITNKDIQKDLQQTSVKDYHKKFKKNFLERLETNENSVFREIAEYNPNNTKIIR
ncbi:hypothetical protein AVEN_124755-1 [Araneus ventricosus]|uniref:Uncharacterized protein n=1 Tax=Araneus ventricosus TaxID=182803 RepID=A0A4Y2D5E9_ARAVE|nr:hypothetical protein AVEN_124755-1 [Araneus ventricosus]